MNRVFALGVPCLVSLLLAACGGGDAESARGAGGSEADLRKSVAKVATAFYRHNDVRALYENLTEDCRRRESFADFAAKIGIGRAMLPSFWGVDAEDVRVASVTVRNFTPTRAETSGALETKDGKEITRPGDEWTTYLFEAGSWHADDCAD